MWQGTERRSRESRLARALVTARSEASELEQELERVPKWRFRRRDQIEGALDELRDQEEQLLVELGGRNGSAA
jgi:hypothetical protein